MTSAQVWSHTNTVEADWLTYSLSSNISCHSYILCMTIFVWYGDHFFFFFTFKYGVWKFWDHTAKSFYRSLQYICLVNTTYCGLILNNWVDVSTVHGDWRPDVKCKLVLASHKVTCIWLQVGLLYMNAWQKALNKCKHKILVNIIFCGIIINGWNPPPEIIFPFVVFPVFINLSAYHLVLS